MSGEERERQGVGGGQVEGQGQRVIEPGEGREKHQTRKTDEVLILALWVPLPASVSSSAQGGGSSSGC